MRLGVNVDHVATLRNARGGSFPDPVEAAKLALASGADGITLHVREDRRHMRDDDLFRMQSAGLVPLNLEMAATPEMVALAVARMPHAVCLVPERRAEITTEGGLDAAGQHDTLASVVTALRDAGCRVSLFIDPDRAQIDAALRLGAPVVELHTGQYADGVPGALDRLRTAAAHAITAGLECHAGHGLNLANTAAVAAIPGVAELNIGHALFGQAIFDGLPATIAAFRAAIARGQTRLADEPGPTGD